jgi:hypothetical protein
MLSGRTFAGKRLPLTIAFTLLLLAAFGAGCKGFFVAPTLTSITINPTAPTVQVGSNITLSAYGVNSNSEGSYLTSGVSWSTSDPTIAVITGSCATTTCGSVSVQGVAAGSATITAGSQSVTNTATLTVVLPNVTNFQVCEGTFGSTSSCSNASSALVYHVSGTNGGTQTFIAQGTSSGTVYDLTTQSTWTLSSTPTAGSISCTNSDTTPETCVIANNTTLGTYPIVVSYGGNGSTAASATLDIVVQ